ncbi:MAG: FlgD immunoglobulin-like domain containing protein [Candidatus Kryptoniota bacterium]
MRFKLLTRLVESFMLFGFVFNASAQTNPVPIGTSGNKYVLTVQNQFPWTLDSVHVKLIASPQWITFATGDVVIDSIAINQTAQASFDFSVSNVQAGLSDSAKFIITDPLGHGFDVRTVAFSTETSVSDGISETGLEAAYPNPSNPSTTIRYSLRENAQVTLIIYDILGRQVRTLVNGELGSGQHSTVWNGMDDHGTTAASGVYFVRFTARSRDGIKQFSSKILMLK